MSDEGEKTCPLCAEDMDLTDQQLKPCKCGYEICVWCWHQIMDLAEKDETGGRCPACRALYDKEKIVGTASNCERLVSEINLERKMKSQKAKTKSSEGRKQLSSVRVIQRNLVYIVGLPLNLADEDLLQHREYFGQYGKVQKVSMSRTAAGAIQQFPNNTCSVYITYSKEEEAIRCIQSVHGFILDGRSLRACFGTTKYCHAWLRNVPCTNPDCLYLHEVGSQEDSFTKDEIISARNKVQQITGAMNNLQRRSGSVLPSPIDDYSSNSSASTAKPITKNASNNTPSVVRSSPPNASSTSRSIGLPAAAAWGIRASNTQPTVASISCSNEPSKQKPDTANGTLAFSTPVANTTMASALHNDVGKKPTLNEESHTIQAKPKLDTLKSLKQHTVVEHQTTESDNQIAPESAATVTLSNQLCPSVSKDNYSLVRMPEQITNSFDHTGSSCDFGPEKVGNYGTDEKIQNLYSDLSAVSFDRNRRNEHSSVIRPNCSLSDHSLIKSPGNPGLQQYCAEKHGEPLISSPAVRNVAPSINGACVSREQSDWSDSQTQILHSTSNEVEEDILSFDSQRLMDPEIVNQSKYFTNKASSLHASNHSGSHFVAVNSNADPSFVDSKASDGYILQASSISDISNGYPENLVSSSGGLDRIVGHSLLLPDEVKGKHLGRLQGDATNADSNAALDMGENSIISNILSMDFDAWDDSLTSPQNLAKLLGETDKQPSSLKISGSWKAQNNNQSRFSFARQEESKNQAYEVEPSFSDIRQFPKNPSFRQDFPESRDSYIDKFGMGNGFSSSGFEEQYNFSSGHSALSSNKLSVSRAQISAPPGFSAPSRAPPPGFSSHDRIDQAFDTLSGNHLLDTSAMLRNSYQALPSGNSGSASDIEFMDPAILAVGKGRLQGGLNNPGLDMRPNFNPQLSALESEARLQLLMQRSLSPRQNLRFADTGDGFSHLNDSYGISSRLMDQTSNLSPFAQLSLQQSRNGLMSNGQWDGWNEVQSGNNLGVAEILRNERVGFNKFYSGYEDPKFRMPNSGDLYNRTYGI